MESDSYSKIKSRAAKRQLSQFHLILPTKNAFKISVKVVHNFMLIYFYMGKPIVLVPKILKVLNIFYFLVF